MPHVEESSLLLIDTVLQSAGALLLGALLVRLLRAGQWRNPLLQLDFSGGGPRALHILGVLAVYVLLLSFVRPVGFDPQRARISGTHDWHLAQCIDAAAKLVVCALMLAVLRRHRSFSARTGSRGLGAGGMLRVGGAAALVILPIAYLQLQMGQIVWQWLEPDATPPTHAVLEALQNSAWGRWGTLQVSLAAIVIAPITEELFFRGLLLQAIWRYAGHAWPAITLSAVAFGFIHHQQPQDVLPLITMGVILGYIRVRYRSLTACILAHALFNARTMAFALLNPEMVQSG